MKNKLPKFLYGPWLLSLTMLLAISVPSLAQSKIKNDVQIEAERTENQSLELGRSVDGQNSSRPMAFPDPYCEVDGLSWVEPITRVIFADVDNASLVSSTETHEDFTSVVANVDAGDTYTFTLEGHTGGNFSNYVIVWIDWDQDGVFDESTERYEIGVIENSNGGDGIQVIEDIEVPADAAEGQTRMRVLKRFGTTAGNADSCTSATSFGQAEDYTVEVASGGGATGEDCDAPNVVSALPYDDAGNTGDYGNNYTSGDVPAVAPGAVTTGTGSTSYLNGDDVVYAYTPAIDQVLNISTTNDDDWIGLWAFTGCPFTSTVGYHTSTGGATRSIEELPVTAGETYYFVISTWPSPDSTDYTILIEEAVGGGGDFVCEDQFNDTNGIENGLFFGGTTNQILAVDIIVGDDGFTAYGSNFNIFLAAGQDAEDVTFDLKFYDDQAGAPGNEVHTSAGTVKSTEFVGENFGYDVYTFEVEFDDAADFDANTTYWMSVDSNGEAWEATSSGIFGAGMAFFNDNTTGDWIVDNSEDLVYSLICEEFDDNDYCIPQGTTASRYIDNFSTTGGSDNVSNMGSGFSPDGYGDFYDTHTIAQEQGEDVEFEVDIEGGIAGFRVWVDWNQDGVFDETEEVAYSSTGYENTHTGTITVPADALEGDTRMRIVSHWLSTTGDVDPCETGFTYGEFEDYKFTVGEGTGGAGTACEQVFYDVDQPTAIGFSSGNSVANDITVAAGESFTLETMTFDVVTIDGDPSEFDLEIFEDNGSGGVGSTIGITHHFDSSNMTFVENGTFSVYTQYTVTLTLPEIELTAGASDDERYWLAIASDLSSTGDFTYWVSYDYVTNSDSFPTWQYNTNDGWFEYVDTDNLTKEGIMTVSGICSGDGGTGGGGFVCDDQFNVSNAIENGLFFGGTTNQILAVDIIVGDDGFTAYGSNLNIFLAAGQTTDDLTFDFIFYDEDSSGLPGAEVHTSAGTVHSSVFVGENFGYDVYTFEIEFDDAADFDANATYWMSVDSNGEAWEATSAGIFGAGMAFANDNTTGDWTLDSTEDLVYSLICEEFDDNDYCIPQGTNADRYVDNFSTTGGSENISNMGSGFSTDGYGDFYDTHTVAQAQGEDIEFTVDIEGGIAGFRVWVDWNQDGVFDTTEEVAYSSNGYENSHTGTITVPEDALEGDTRMRIVSHWLSTTGDVDPCETGFTYGEFEDYKFTVEEGTVSGNDCSQSTASNGMENGWGNVSLLIYGNDFVVAEDEVFTLEEIKVNFLLSPGFDIETADIYFYEDTGGNGPGAEIPGTAILGSVPNSLTLLDVHSAGFEQIEGVWTLDTPVDFEGSTSGETVYWMGIQIEYLGDSAYIETSSIYSTPNESYFSDDGGATWVSGLVNFGDDMHGVITFSGQCEIGLGVEDQSSTDFAYYPNPTSDVLNIAANKDITSVAVYNLLGQQVLAQNRLDNGEVDVSTLPTGAYVFHVQFEDGSMETFKILKE